MDTFESIMEETKKAAQQTDKEINEVIDSINPEVTESEWNKIKQDGSGHYKTIGVEPIDLYKDGGILHDFAIGSIIKYAFRSRKEMNLPKELFLKNMEKILHYANMLRAVTTDKQFKEDIKQIKKKIIEEIINENKEEKNPS